MADIDHYWGDDLQFSDQGDLVVVSGTTEGVQRVLRRLLTNLGTYIWHPRDYGTGVRAKVGAILDVQELTSLIRSQIFLEAAVSPTPEPTIEVTPTIDGAFVRIQYWDALTQSPAVTAFDITR